MKLPPVPELRSFDRNQLMERLRRMAPFYLCEWDARREGGAGSAILQAFTHLHEGLIGQFNKVPRKYMVEFLDRLGFDLEPAQYARAFITFQTVDGTPGNVFVPKGAEVAGVGLDDEGSEEPVLFQTESSLSVSPARLKAVFSVDGRNVGGGQDSFIDHSAALEEEEPYILWEGDSLQEHAMYIGHSDLFNQEEPSEFRLEVQLAEGGDPDFSFSFEYWNGTRWVSMGGAIQDSTRNFVSDGTLTYSKQFKEEIAELELEGVTSRWLRLRATKALAEGAPRRVPVFDTVRVRVTPNVPLVADLLFHNDQPLELEPGKEIVPLGENPQISDVFYIASEEVFSKKGSRVDVRFTFTLNKGKDGPSQQLDTIAPVLRWEYFSEGKKTWRKLSVEDGTENFLAARVLFPFIPLFFRRIWRVTEKTLDITFVCPDDIARSKVNGEESFWIRARLLTGNYGDEFVALKRRITIKDFNDKKQPVDFVTQEQKTIHFPIVKTLTITYESEFVPPQHCLTKNNGMTQDETSAAQTSAWPFHPFVPLPASERALYLGFDGPLTSGPLRIFANVREHSLGGGEMVELRWNFWNGQEWERIPVKDSTRGLTKIGTVEWIGKAESRLTLFGHHLIWIKAEVVDGEYSRPVEIRGLHLNAVRAIQSSVIEDEILGSSSGEADQSFQLLNSPVIDQEVWVLEAGDIERKVLDDHFEEEEYEALDEILDARGDLVERWIRWHVVEDFDGSRPDSRHFRIDRRKGEVTFGNGKHGLIPPRAADGIKISYRFGGGTIGNVEPGKIASLKSALPFIESVSNPLAADGGAAPETLEDVFIRGPRALKHRQRAVSIEDFEWIAQETFRKVRRARCLSNLDAELHYQIGAVTLLIVPESEDARPEPTTQLKSEVRAELLRRSSPLLVDSDRFYVCAPTYVEVKVVVSVVPTDIAHAAQVEREALHELDRFIHPLTGGSEACGWPFGRDVLSTDLITLLEGVNQLDYVEELTLFADGTKTEGSVTIDAFSLPVSGQHKVVVSISLGDESEGDELRRTTCRDAPFGEIKEASGS